MVLPVHFVSASAIAVNNAVNISWKTASESLSITYAIEHSTDGKSYSEVGTVRATGANGYAFTHHTPTVGYNYYRIHATDQQGGSLYSSVAKVLISQGTQLTVAAYPNPVFNSLSLSFNNFPSGVYTVRIIDALGKTVRQINVNLDGSTTKQLEASGLAKGCYLLQVAAANGKSMSSQLIFKQ